MNNNPRFHQVLTILALLLTLRPAAANAQHQIQIGTNPQGDLVEWADGRKWRNVTVTEFRLTATNATKLPEFKIQDVPKGAKEGWFSAVKGISLRGEPEHLPELKGAILAPHIWTGGDPQSLPGLKPLDPKKQYADVYMHPRPSEWQPLRMPPYSGNPAGDKDTFAQTMITISHVLVADGQPYFLVRRTAKVNLIPEGWYKGVTATLFGRELVADDK